MRDPLANSVAVIVLLGMVGATVYSIYRSINPRKRSWPGWWIPVLALAGIFVASYLAYIEITLQDAICGPVGDCNAVQQSPYAHLFGFLPVAILGLFGYGMILILAIIRERSKQELSSTINLVMWGIALIGVLFMMYLTFLEPFVIGATCMWCLSSAILMTLILLAATPQPDAEGED
jgi:uncharacterized membrane protein